jgi:non-specific serine/threonine protein kinase
MVTSEEHMAGRRYARIPDTLPRPLTSFIGRQKEISAVSQTLASTRLLTLVGAGGCGKTRLARAIAAASFDAWPDGVWWIDLAPLTDPALVVQVIAAALHVAEKPSQSLLDLLCSHLSVASSLLIFDNCEHLIERCAQVAQTLLSACPALTILATSRETLNISGETVYAVPCLTLPDDRDSFDAIAQSEAVQLFVERVRAVEPGFTLTQATVAATVAICRRLDGLPLAIELAASRVRMLSPDAIAERLTSAISLLIGGSRTALPRHQTLRATLDWSYALLPEAEARLFQRLAVFTGGFTLEGAEAVGEGDGEMDVLRLLGYLIDKSLVVVQRVPNERDSQSGQGDPRYHLLEILRQYGVEKLNASSQLEDARSRHFAYYLQLAEQAETELEGAAQLQWLNRIEWEHDNIRAALRWSIEQARDDSAARLASRIWRFWLVRGYLSEGRSWLRQALELAPERSLTRACALLVLSILTYYHESYSAAITLVEEALALFRELDDTKGLATAVLNAGILALGHGDYAKAIACFEESLPLCAQVNYTHGAVLSLSSMGQAALNLGEYARAQALGIQSVAMARASGDNRIVAGCLTDLGVTLFTQGEHARALPHFEESLAIRRLHGDKGGAAHTLLYLGRVALAQGQPADAHAHFQESLALRLAIGDLEGQAAALEGLGALATYAGDGATAAHCFGAAVAARERASAVVLAPDRAFTERWIAAARDLLGEEAFARELTAGRALSPEAAGRAPYAVSAPSAVTPITVDSPPELQRPPGVGRAPRPPLELRIFVLGAPRVYVHGKLLAPSDWTYSKAHELLFFLLAHGPATKARIGLALWPDADAAHVRSQLHPVLHACRRALGDPAWVLFEGGRYRFNRERTHSYDVTAFETTLAQARQALASAPTTPDAQRQAISLLESAMRMYHGDFFASETGDAAGEWIATYRVGLRQRWLDAGALLAGLLVSTDDHTRAVTVYRRLIEADPYQEQAHRALMLLLARLGERAQALRHFESLTRLLRDELATSPAPETAALAQALRSGAQV